MPGIHRILSNAEWVIAHQDWIRYVTGQIAAQYTFSGSFPGYTVRWYHYDRLGSVMNLTDSSANVVASYDQDAYGNTISNMTTGQWASSISGRHLTTKEADSDAGLYYFYQRWYEPGVGRFINQDPLGFVDGHNLYRFVHNNPQAYSDPAGTYSSAALFACTAVCEAIVAGVCAYTGGISGAAAKGLQAGLVAAGFSIGSTLSCTGACHFILTLIDKWPPDGGPLGPGPHPKPWPAPTPTPSPNPTPPPNGWPTVPSPQENPPVLSVW